ncbi:GIY-YIG nuclease family protein [Flavobacterium sp. K5-23]|uniref:GIY-YIG nuclease family protein n=1 Tax=Flavobacterium sp. K5-23 TaxID=2746225 RepID=UPI00200DBE4E|nr:GIY-YIG nuclease family protein [Flavobacterium sp. K5-23]UQD57047.1 GIY-YIG nuclease family protein [Flavobacterium sp. K5-23]
MEDRIIRHNQKSKRFTGSINDWKVVYLEKYCAKEQAQHRELKIKSWKVELKYRN